MGRSARVDEDGMVETGFEEERTCGDCPHWEDLKRDWDQELGLCHGQESADPKSEGWFGTYSIKRECNLRTRERELEAVLREVQATLPKLSGAFKSLLLEKIEKILPRKGEG